ncbi:MAG: CapA family protein [Chlorobi bacterium]|nr:CapA family protein [Chlorobiota bacterium]
MFSKIVNLTLIGLLVFFQAQSNSLGKEPLDSVKKDFSDTLHLSILVAGDIMQHDSQINSAFNSATKKHNYDSCFSYVSPILKSYDVAVANLEVTLAGKPFKGYPQFSAPDELAYALKNAGFNCLLTANNHACDRRKQGINRTIKILDSLKIPHLGTYADSLSRAKTYPLIINKNGFKLSFLNYTYSTNGIPVPKPAIVNLIDTSLIKTDLKKATDSLSDLVIVFMHWGAEYQRLPNKFQKKLANFCLMNGADFVIGSHPHVIQPMQKLQHPADSSEQTIIVYSLGNYVSNQRKRYTDGGAMIGIHLSKIMTTDTTSKVTIDSAGYYLTYVHKIKSYNKQHFYIIPVSEYENDTVLFKLKADKRELKQFSADSRLHYSKHNIGIDEFVYDTISNSFLFKRPVVKEQLDTVVHKVKIATQKDTLLSFKIDTIYKIQFFVSSRTFDKNILPKEWQNLVTTETVKDSLTRYMIGKFASYDSAGTKLNEVKQEFPDAFIINTVIREKEQ